MGLETVLDMDDTIEFEDIMNLEAGDFVILVRMAKLSSNVRLGFPLSPRGQLGTVTLHRSEQAGSLPCQPPTTWTVKRLTVASAWQGAA